MSSAQPTGCKNRAGGAYTGVLQGAGTLDGKTQGPMAGLGGSTGDGTALTYLVGGNTTDTAVVGFLLKRANATNWVTTTWDYTGPGCVTTVYPNVVQYAWLGAVGPGALWSVYNHTTRLPQREAVQVWANPFGEMLYVDPVDCEPLFIAGEFVNSLGTWSGMLFTEGDAVEPPASALAIPARCSN